MSFHVIIPARYDSTRFKGKLLAEIQGMSVLERVYRQALKAKPASIIIATDHELIAEHAKGFQAEVVMTKPTHQSGTDRIAETVALKAFDPNAIIVNVQGDEPFIPPALITQVADCLVKQSVSMATLCWPIEDKSELVNPNVVKVVVDKNQTALYFSRSAIPFHRDQPEDHRLAYKHIGIYAYKAGFLQDFVTWPVCDLEAYECLEQLRVLWQGHKIAVDVACEKPKQDINTPEDLKKANDLATTSPQQLTKY